MQTPVIETSRPLPYILQIRMCDKDNKNTFSTALTDGLITAFGEAEHDITLKAVILTGYGNYFASGGTQETLLTLAEGRASFTDTDLYSLSLRCPVPVIAAMQGHAIGGGFVLGLFADFVLLSRESIYTANFMRYGFTPGMGATYVVPEKLGVVLGHELLMAGDSYRGEELQRRGIPLPVLPREQVPGRALELAQTLAEKPRISLTTLKRHLTAKTRQVLPAIVAQELDMHRITFQQAAVAERIKGSFGH